MHGRAQGAGVISRRKSRRGGVGDKGVETEGQRERERNESRLEGG